jgi:hypothetical protein
MKTRKAAISTSLAIAGLVISSGAIAQLADLEAPTESSIKQCVAEIGEQANYIDASRVRHVVDFKERRYSGHSFYIDTTVFGSDGSEVIREYATVCAVSDEAVTKRFKIKEKSV